MNPGLIVPLINNAVRLTMSSLKEHIDLSRLPNHVAIIMDGNGRWAKMQGNNRIFGHHHGVESVRQTVEAAGELGVKYLTLYAFSKENWCRPKTEIDALMSLMMSTIDAETETLMKNQVKLTVIGDLNDLPEKVQTKLNQIQGITAVNEGLQLIIALNYSGRWEITEAAKQIAHDIQKGSIQPGSIDENKLCQYLVTSNIPDPELLIRTSGEFRLSNFLLWQIAYTELYFTKTLWPDFRKKDLYEAIIDFQKRERRFGKTSEQIVKCE
jgi:undecaprenyl diphosphate synthase